MSKKSKFTGRRKDEPKEDRKITIRHRAIDGAYGMSKFSSLKWAQKEAHKWVGEHPEIGSDYAVSGDGIVRVMITGASFDEIFPNSTSTPPKEMNAVVTETEPKHDDSVNTEHDEHEGVEEDGDQSAELAPEGTGEVHGGIGGPEGGGEADNPEAGTGEDEPAAEPKSVVAPRFKKRYIANAKANGIKGKAARRSNWDWLAQLIAKQCLIKDKISIQRFLEVLDANGVDHSKWTNRSVGWEGRLRMTGRVALQRVVADAGQMKVPDPEAEGGFRVEVPPAEFIEKYKSKE